MELSTVDNTHGKEVFLMAIGLLLKSIAIALTVSVLIAIASVMMWERPYSMDRLVDFLTFRYSWPTWNYDATFSLVAELIPVATSVLTIAIMGQAIVRASTRRQWIITSILVVITAITTICTLLLFAGFGRVFNESIIVDVPSLEFWFYSIAFCGGLALATLIHPRSQGLRVMVASLMAAAIGGVLELIMLSLLILGPYS